MTTKIYTPEIVQESLTPKYQEYFAKLAVGQSENWKCDQRASDLFCIQQWLRDELTVLGCSDADRLDVQFYFNRKARSEEDLYELAARSINSWMTGTIERFHRK